MSSAYGRIYRITNLANGKQYVGQTVRRIRERFSQHCQAGRGHCRALSNAIQKYGKELFLIDQIEECDTQAQLNDREAFWIATLNTLSPHGYNLRAGDNRSALSEDSRTLKREQWCDPCCRAKRIDGIRRKWSENKKEWARAVASGIRAARANPERAGQWSAATKLSANRPDRIAASSARRIEYLSRPGVVQSISETMKRVMSDPVFKIRHRQCVMAAQNNPETRAKKAAAAKRMWERPGHREMVSAAISASQRDPEVNARRQRNRDKAAWRDAFTKTMAHPQTKERHRRATVNAMARPDVKEKMLAAWRDPEKRARRLAALASARQRIAA